MNEEFNEYIRKEAKKQREANPKIAELQKEANMDMPFKDEAEKILKEGDPFLYLIKSTQKIHVGDTGIIAKLILCGLSSGFKNRKFTLHSLEVGRSGKGKSSVQEHVSLLFDNVETITSTSAKAQLYKAAAGELLNGGILILDEAEGSQEAYVIERALTDDRLRNPKHDTVADNKKYIRLEIKEVNSIWKNSVELPKDEQLNNRYLISNVDESIEQDEAVCNKIKEEFGRSDFTNPKIEELRVSRFITSKIKEIPIKIIIPFAKHIKISGQDNRRTLPKFFKLLRCVTYCYRDQRPVIKPHVVATREDFEIALAIWPVCERIEKSHLTNIEEETLRVIPYGENNAIELKEVSSLIGKETSTAYKRLLKLSDKGYVSYTESREGTKKYFYYRTLNDSERLGISMNWEDFTLEDFNNEITETLKKKGIKLEQKYNSLEIYEKIKNSHSSSELIQVLNPNLLELKKTENEGLDDFKVCSESIHNLSEPNKEEEKIVEE